ncbi:MAG TPA: hypothetical protein VGG19_06170 [Tepidisphaeraceae bacterium]
MKRSLLVLAAVAAAGLMAGGASANTVVVNSFASSVGTGTWGDDTVTSGGTASVVASAPLGGPLPPGAALLTTDNNPNTQSVVGVGNDYGLASNIISSINLAYSYYKQNDGGADPSAAPSLKLVFYNSTDPNGFSGINRGYTTLVYEPYWNQAVTPDLWTTDSITATQGKFWTTGGFGVANSDGTTEQTLADWLTTFDSNFSSAELVEVAMGLGSTNPGQTGYFDDVQINGTAIANTTYNFQAVPLPASAWSGLALLGGLGLFGAVKRHRRQMA